MPLYFNGVSVSWLEEGFRVGDWVSVTVYSDVGVILQQYTTKIAYVNATDCGFVVLNPLGWYDLTAQESVVIFALDYPSNIQPPPTYSTPRTHGELDVFINHSSSNSAGTPLSLIDGEISRAIFPDLGTLVVGATQQGIMVGNQSGQFYKSCEIQRTNNIGNFAYYTIQVVFA